MLAGSFLLNVGSVWAFRTFLEQMQSSPLALEPVAIEFVEPLIQPASSKNSGSRTAIVAANTTTVPLSNPLPTELVQQNDLSLDTDESSSQPTSLSEKSSFSQTDASKDVSNEPQKTESNAETGREPSPPPAPLDEQEPSPSASRTDPEESATAASPEPLTGPIASGIALPEVPTIPNSDENVATQGPLGDPTAISRNVVPPTVSAYVKVSAYTSNVSLPSGDVPIEDVPTDFIDDINEDSTRTFAAHELRCPLTADSLRAFGQPVKLEISLNEQGTLDDQSTTTVQNPSGNPSYNDLVICVLKQWRFNTASSDFGTLKKAMSHRLEVDVILSR